MDDVANMFTETVKVAGKNQEIGNTIAIKASPIIAPFLLKKMNRFQQILLESFDKADKDKQHMVKGSQVTFKKKPTHC